jgi:hypothetical protein
MKVFISWSGDKSMSVAEAMRDWLPNVIQEVQPWMSRADFDAGSRWGLQLAQELQGTKFGIICLTNKNQLRPWIMFEAGALAKTIENTFVVPYLIDLARSDVLPGPLAQFQAKRITKPDTLHLMKTINSQTDNPLAEKRLEFIFERLWPDLEEKLNNLPQDEPDDEAAEQPPYRATGEILEEVLEVVRGLARQSAEDANRNPYQTAGLASYFRSPVLRANTALLVDRAINDYKLLTEVMRTPLARRSQVLYQYLVMTTNELSPEEAASALRTTNKTSFQGTSNR